jgi:hypothetical protein
MAANKVFQPMGLVQLARPALNASVEQPLLAESGVQKKKPPMTPERFHQSKVALWLRPAVPANH